MTAYRKTLRVDLVKLARSLLVYEGASSDEVALEVYRWIIATGTETGEEWKRRDRERWARFPGFDCSIGRTMCYPPPGLEFALVTQEWRARVAQVIARAVLGDSLPLARWRREMGDLRRAEIPVLMLRGDSGHWTSREPWARLIRRKLRLKVQFNSVHENARALRGVALVPFASGWSLALRYGCLEDKQPDAGTMSSEWTAMSHDALDAADPYSTIPRQGPREATKHFIDRVNEYLNTITEPLRP